MEEQKIAYIPVIAPDALTMLPDGKLPPGGEMGSAIPLIRSIDKSVRGVKDDLWALKKETGDAIAELGQGFSALTREVSATNQDVAGLKQDVAVLKDNVRDLKDNMKSLQDNVSDIRGDIKRIEATLAAFPVKFGLGLAALAIAIPVILTFLQKWVGQ